MPPALDRAAGWSWRLLVCVLAVAAVFVLLWYLRIIVLPTIVALTLAPALMPVVRLVRQRVGAHRPAAALALIVGLVVVAGLLTVVAMSVVSQYDELAEAVRRGASEITAWLEGEPFNISRERVRNFDSSLGDVWDSTSTYLAAGLSAGASLLTGLILAVAMLYFVLRDGAELWRRVLRRFPPDRAPAVDRAGRRAWKVLDGYIRGTALIAAIDATLIGIGIWLLGVPLALPLAVLVFLGGFVPFVGATLSGLVAVLVAFADEGWEIALVTLAIVIGVQLRRGQLPPAHHPEPNRRPARRRHPARGRRRRLPLRHSRRLPRRPGHRGGFRAGNSARRRARRPGEHAGIDEPGRGRSGARPRHDAAAKLGVPATTTGKIALGVIASHSRYR